MAYDQQRLLNGHLLRRIGFGANAQEIAALQAQGWTAYLNAQLNPLTLDDTAAEAKFAPAPASTDLGNTGAWQRRWYSRMVYSRRQLQEKMTLVLHQLFATGNGKVVNGDYMRQQEDLLRSYALGSMKELIKKITLDKAMLIWLDVNNNSGTSKDAQGAVIPPNANYARELLQLFTIGTAMLNRDGTPILDVQGTPVPAYTEADVSAVARILTGWSISSNVVIFTLSKHDIGNKVVFGTTVVGSNTATGGDTELAALVELIFNHPSHAPFIAKYLIQQLATETPTPAYVSYVAQVYKKNQGKLAPTLNALFTHPEFVSTAVVRTQFKTPIEELVGILRAVETNLGTNGYLTTWLGKTGQQIYFPPSVFSFYYPGEKDTLINTGLTLYRDQAADALVADGALFSPSTLRTKYSLTTPEIMLDFLSDALLIAPLQEVSRTRILQYMNAKTDDNAFKGAAWLVMCSTDNQLN